MLINKFGLRVFTIFIVIFSIPMYLFAQEQTAVVRGGDEFADDTEPNESGV